MVFNFFYLMIQKYRVLLSKKIEYYSNPWIFVQKKSLHVERLFIIDVNLLIMVGLITNQDSAI